jgi:hypothetical protein
VLVASAPFPVKTISGHERPQWRVSFTWVGLMCVLCTVAFVYGSVRVAGGAFQHSVSLHIRTADACPSSCYNLPLEKSPQLPAQAALP